MALLAACLTLTVSWMRSAVDRSVDPVDLRTQVQGRGPDASRVSLNSPAVRSGSSQDGDSSSSSQGVSAAQHQVSGQGNPRAKPDMLQLLAEAELQPVVMATSGSTAQDHREVTVSATSGNGAAAASTSLSELDEGAGVSPPLEAAPPGGLAVAAAGSSSAARAPRRGRPPPFAIAHRGASAELPEHTKEGYMKAIEEGADFIECDVVLTRDLVPLCRHEPDLASSTDALAKFPDRRRTYVIDGEALTGVFSVDLTAAEVAQLRAVQPWPFRDQSHNGRYAVATLADYLHIARSANRSVGIYPETKHPTWTNALPAVRAANTTLEDILLGALAAAGFDSALGSPGWRQRPVFLQSFEAASLRYMARRSCAPGILLLGDWEDWVAPDSNRTLAQLTTDESLAEISSWAAGLGMSKSSLVRWQPEAAAGSAAAAAAAANATGHQAAAHVLDTHGAGAGVDAAVTAVSKTAATSAVKHRRRLRAAVGKAAVVTAAATAAGRSSGVAVAAASTSAAAPNTGRYVSTGVAERAQSHRLQVHAYTLRPEPQFFLPHLTEHVRSREQPPPPLAPVVPGANATVADEYELFLEEVVALDGLFADHMPSLQQWLRQHQLGRSPLLAQLSPQQAAAVEAGGSGRGGAGGRGGSGGKGGRGQKGRHNESGGQQAQGRGRAGSGKEVATRPGVLGAGGGVDAVEMMDIEAKVGGGVSGRREVRADRGSGQGGRERGGAYGGAGNSAGGASGGGGKYQPRVLENGLRCEAFRGAGAGNRQFQGR
ncbi:hypothetical protein HYH02_006900 [Chlamydomonas schloesseri]|uniref:glycerophosphodiester phosphodiesterase n=1 Tax=Chlamydomonas schloesseri TaxID=2026947 RepID=A0A835WJ07_9CHLO|nr:hypothetical protein HYH02_006900 [Chlamydomonas schloesseri]|eukprot:KAG2448316.1 hypothetical protein HYH02_006900 [Chlamydomonas schloesseri]